MPQNWAPNQKVRTIIGSTQQGEKKREGETKLVFSPKLVLTRVSLPVLDLHYLCLHCCLYSSVIQVQIEACESHELIPSFIELIPSSHSDFKTHPRTNPYCPPTNLLTYIIKLKANSPPIYLLTYKFKMCYFHPHPPTQPPSIYLPTNILGRYLPNPTLHGYTYLPSWLALQ
jgi:hypothetical protein